MSHRTTAVIASLVLALAIAPAHAGDDAMKAAAEAATEALSDRPFVAKIDLGTTQKFFVLPDGSPSDEAGRKQGSGGYGPNTIWMPGGKVKVRAGETGHSIYVSSTAFGQSNEKKYWVHLNKKPGQRLNPALVTVIFDRPVTPEDVTPEKVALAVSSLVTIEGYEPGAAVAAVLDKVLESAPAGAPDGNAAPAAPAAGPDRPTVLSLAVRAEPARVRPGDEVRLALEYAVAAPGGPVSAIETRNLMLAGTSMPTYPVKEPISRAAGSYTSVQRQPLPVSATPGVYTFEGEVCVGADCIRRSATFEVASE